MTGELAVCAGTCGPGSLHFVNGIFESHRNGAPVVLVASDVARSEVGLNFPQAVDQRKVYEQTSVFCEYISHPSQARRITTLAAQAALNRRGVAVVIVNGDMFTERDDDGQPWSVHRPSPVLRPADAELDELANTLDGAAGNHALRRHGRARRPRPGGGAGADTESAGGPQQPRQGIHRAGQPVQRRHDRHTRQPRRAGRDRTRRHPALPRHRFRLEPVLPRQGADHPDRFRPDAPRQALADPPRAGRRRRRDHRRPAAQARAARRRRAPDPGTGAVAERPRGLPRRRAGEGPGADPSAVRDAVPRPPGRRRRHIHRRRRQPHGLAAAPPERQRQAPFSDQPAARHHGQRLPAGDGHRRLASRTDR